MVGGHDEIIAFFDGINTGPVGQSLDEMSRHTPTRKEVSNQVLLTMGTAQQTFEKFQEDFGFDGIDEFKALPDLEKHGQREILKAQAFVPQGFDVVVNRIASGSLGFGVEDVVRWSQGGGPAPTTENMKTAYKILVGMKTVLQPVTDALKGNVNPDSDFDKGMLSYPAWEHYNLGVLESCSCHMSALIDTFGVRLDEIPDYKDMALSNFARIAEMEVDTSVDASSVESPQKISDIAPEIAEEYGLDQPLS